MVGWQSLSPMVDIHNHLLWGLDDGASTIEESLAMLEVAGESGTTDIVATPHANAHYIYQPELTVQRIQELQSRVACPLKIHRACEFHLSFDNVNQLFQWPFTYTVNGNQYLLLECPEDHIGGYADDIVRRIVALGLIPIIAHPERNQAMQGKLEKLEAWIDAGCLVQITALSLLGGFGGFAKAASFRMLERGIVHMVASDAHDPRYRSPRMDQAYRAVGMRYGDSWAELLFTENPMAVVKGLPLPGGRQPVVEKSTKWYQFWRAL